MTPFLRAYIECALWSSTDFNGEPLDVEYGVDDLAPETLAQCEKDCDSFVAEAGALLDAWGDEQAGHDFWLTRNRHGAGFWDRGLPNGRKLTDMANPYGEVQLYVGDDGLIYI